MQMTRAQAWPLSSVMLILTATCSLGCSSDCTPIDTGGVVVDVRGAAACDQVSIVAIRDSTQSALDATGSFETDGGLICEYQGLIGQPGAYEVQLEIGGTPKSSQAVVLQKLDSCNVSSQLLEFDASSP